MLTHPLCGNPRRIEQFLAGQLNAADERQIELHLESCADCRSHLEAAAAEGSYWSEVATHLSNDDFDCEITSGHAEPGECALWSTHDDKPELLRVGDYLDPTDDPRMLGRFGGYEIAGIVGSGGMGIVLKGFETALDRYVAIKVLAPHLAMSGAARTRFAREARAAAAVLHENVVSIHRVAEANGLPFLVMPYIPGDSLMKRLDRQGPLAVPEVLRIGMQAAAGLAAAHAQGLVHRDIKPGNILLDSGVERVTITDFGLARAADDASLTRSGVITGTPQFMSPEQARGEPVDARSDLFSLGSVLYAMCTGRPPFRADSAYGVLRRIGEAEPRPIRELAPETPEWLCEIVEKLHAKKVDDRFSSASEVADLLRAWLMHLQQPMTTPAPQRLKTPACNKPTQALWRNWRMPALVAGLATVAAALVLTVTLPQTPSDENSANKNVTSSSNTTTQAAPAAPEQPLVDEQTMYRNYQQVRQRVSAFQRDWTASPAPQNSWEAEIPKLRQQIDELSRRIDSR